MPTQRGGAAGISVLSANLGDSMAGNGIEWWIMELNDG